MNKKEIIEGKTKEEQILKKGNNPFLIQNRIFVEGIPVLRSTSMIVLFISCPYF